MTQKITSTRQIVRVFGVTLTALAGGCPSRPGKPAPAATDDPARSDAPTSEVDPGGDWDPA